MMVTTRGYGPGASIPAVVMRGYTSAAANYFLRSPIADDVAGLWTAVGSASLFGAIDEATPNDSDYIQSSTAPSFDVARVKLAPASAPMATGQRVRICYRLAQDNTTQSLNLTTTLKQGTTPIAVWSNDLGGTQFTTFKNLLTDAQVAAISDWTDLHLEFDANPPNSDTIALLATSQLGVGSDATHTVYNSPFVRITLGAGRVAGDILQLVINGVDDGSVVLQTIDITHGYVDKQLVSRMAGSYSVQSCIVRSGARSALTAAATFTIMPLALDNMKASLYAAHGVVRLLSSYAGPLFQVIRKFDGKLIDFFPNIDGYADLGAPYAWVRNQVYSPTLNRAYPFINKLYDQTGNGRDAVAVSQTRNLEFYSGNADGDSGFDPSKHCVDWGWRGQARIRAAASNAQGSFQETLTINGMGAFAQSVTGLTIMGTMTEMYFGGPEAIVVSTNASTELARLRIFSTALAPPNDIVNAAGRRQDGDTEVVSPGIFPPADPLYPTQLRTTQFGPLIARVDYANAALKFVGWSSTVTQVPFQSAGATDNTPSAAVTIGGTVGSGTFKGGMISSAFFQRAITDAEIADLTTTNQFNFEAMPRRYLIRAGATLGIEAYRAQLINKLYLGGSPPAGGFDTLDPNHTDPLVGQGGSPSNLDHFDHHTIFIKNDVGTTVWTTNIGVWWPTPGTTNNKLIIYQAGYEGYPPTASPFKDADFIRNMVQNGYTMTYIDGPFTPTLVLPGFNAPSWGDPTATLNPLRYYVETPIRALNALIGSFPSKPPLLFGFSGGAAAGSLLTAAIDTRFAATIAFADPEPMNVTVNKSGGIADERAMMGLVDDPVTGGCDFTDLMVLCTTGGTVTPRICGLSFQDDQATALANSQEFFTSVRDAVSLYSGQFYTHFNTFDTSHSITTATQNFVLTLFGRY